MRDKLLSIQKRLSKMKEISLSSKKDISGFFVDVNDITSEVGLFVDVQLATNEVYSAISEFVKEVDLETTKDKIIYTDVPLFLAEDEEAVNFEVTYIDDSGDEVKSTCDIVLQCAIKIEAINRFFIKPELFFIAYDPPDSDVIEEDEEKIDELPDEVFDKQLDAEAEDLDAEEYDVGDEEFDEDFADEDLVRDFIKNVIVAKIYDNGYDYPNEETIDEMTNKILDYMNDLVDETLQPSYISDVEDEKEDEKEDGEKVEKAEDDDFSDSDKFVNTNQSVKKLPKDKNEFIEFYENKKGARLKNMAQSPEELTRIMEEFIEAGKENRKEMFFIFTIRHGANKSGMVHTVVFNANTEKEAKNMLSAFMKENYGEDAKWEVLDVLKVAANEILDD